MTCRFRMDQVHADRHRREREQVRQQSGEQDAGNHGLRRSHPGGAAEARRAGENARGRKQCPSERDGIVEAVTDLECVPEHDGPERDRPQIERRQRSRGHATSLEDEAAGLAYWYPPESSITIGRPKRLPSRDGVSTDCRAPCAATLPSRRSTTRSISGTISST